MQSRSGTIIGNAIETRGFELLPALFGCRELSTLIEAVEHTSVPRSRAGLRHALRCPELKCFAHDARLLKIAAQVLGPDAFPFHATLFDKSPRANWLVVWHQDTALPLRERHESGGWGPWSVKDGVNYAHAPASALSQVLALRVHLDASLVKNGPLRVLPGTHKLGVLSDDQIHQLCLTIDPEDCTMPAGGVLAMRPLLVHASSKSRVTASRRVLHIEYAASETIHSTLRLARD